MSFLIPTSGSQTYSIVGGPDGNIWFYETFGNKIGTIAEGRSIVEYPFNPNESQQGQEQIARGDGSYLWFIGGSGIWKITTSGTITLAVRGPKVFYQGIAEGPDGNIWAAAAHPPSDNSVIRLSPKTGTFTEFTTPTSNSDPQCMTVGPDGNMWFAEGVVNKVAKITMTGQITEYPLPDGISPSCLVVGDDGNLYAGDFYAEVLHRITVSGTVTSYATSIAADFVAAGPHHQIWMSLAGDHQGGLQTFDTQTQTFSNLMHFQGQGPLAKDSDGNMWFIDKTQYIDLYDRPY